MRLCLATPIQYLIPLLHVLTEAAHLLFKIFAIRSLYFVILFIFVPLNKTVGSMGTEAMCVLLTIVCLALSTVPGTEHSINIC